MHCACCVSGQCYCTDCLLVMCGDSVVHKSNFAIIVVIVSGSVHKPLSTNGRPSCLVLRPHKLNVPVSRPVEVCKVNMGGG